jgi:hypothetical protein
MDEPLKTQSRPQTQTRKVDAADKRNIALTKEEIKRNPFKRNPFIPFIKRNCFINQRQENKDISSKKKALLKSMSSK